MATRASWRQPSAGPPRRALPGEPPHSPGPTDISLALAWAWLVGPSLPRAPSPPPLFPHPSVPSLLGDPPLQEPAQLPPLLQLGLTPLALPLGSQWASSFWLALTIPPWTLSSGLPRVHPSSTQHKGLQSRTPPVHPPRPVPLPGELCELDRQWQRNANGGGGVGAILGRKTRWWEKQVYQQMTVPKTKQSMGQNYRGLCSPKGTLQPKGDWASRLQSTRHKG